MASAIQFREHEEVPMRLVVLLMLLLAAGLLVGCYGSSPASPSPSSFSSSSSASTSTSTSRIYDRISGEDDRWGVGVLHPRFEGSNTCHEDPSVDLAVQSADMPSSRLGIRLSDGSTEADALRIAECLARELSSGEISITSPVS